MLQRRGGRGGSIERLLGSRLRGWGAGGTGNLPRSSESSRVHGRPMVMVALWKGHYAEIHSLHRPRSDKSSRNGSLASWVGKEDRPVGGARVPWHDIVAK